MSEIVANHLKDRDKIEIFDPTSGSGSLLINIGKSASKYIEGENKVKYYAQELKQNTYNLTRMNLVMRGIEADNIVTRNGDTLEDDWPYFDENDPTGTYNPLYVDAVVSNPRIRRLGIRQIKIPTLAMPVTDLHRKERLIMPSCFTTFITLSLTAL